MAFKRPAVLASVLALACRCGSAQAPSPSDCLTVLSIACTPAGSDLACSAAYDCGSTATPRTVWASSNPTVAAFNVPTSGHLTVLAPGQVFITASVTYPAAAGELIPENGLGFVVAPGTVPQQLVDLSVIIEDSITGKPLQSVSASVQVVPAQGLPESCQTSSHGLCDVWLAPVASVTVSATAMGYLTGSITTALETGYNPGVILKLVPQTP